MLRIRVLVADDSLTLRGRLVEVLSADSEFEVVGEAENGERAVELCRILRPDVMTMDMMMPVMDGLRATERIMANHPTPILVVSASTNRGELFRTYDALAAGAVDVLEKPRESEVLPDWEERLRRGVRRVSRIKVITHLRARMHGLGARFEPRLSNEVGSTASPRRTQSELRAVAIGTSTGGPAALKTLLPALTSDFPLPILLVVHLAEYFSAAFAEWLDGLSPLRVSTAVDGEPLPPPGSGRVILAPSDSHLVLRGNRVALTRTPPRHSCRPSVDELFESFARELGPKGVACLLTGMGHDGAAGLLAVRRAGGVTLAQDEATSVVFGMPKEAIEREAAHEVLPLDRFAPVLASLAGGKS